MSFDISLPQRVEKKGLVGELAGIFFLILSIFFTISLASYYAYDPSINSATPGATVRNLGGMVGSYLADASLQLWGISAGWFVLVLLVFAVSCVRRKLPDKFLGKFCGFFGLIVGTATFLSLSHKHWSYGGATLLSGGVVGEFVALKLTTYFNRVGAYLVLTWLLLSTSLIVFRFSPIGILTFILDKGKKRGLSKSVVNTVVTAAPRGEKKPLFGFLKKEKAKKEVVNAVKAEESESEELSLEQKKELIRARLREKLEKKDQGGFSALSKMDSKKKLKFTLPSLPLLGDPPRVRASKEGHDEVALRLTQVLREFGVEGRVNNVEPGPVITRYEFEPAAGIKLSRIVNLENDLALALSALSVRIIAPIQGKSAVGFEIPNREREQVYLKELLSNNSFQTFEGEIPLVLGKDISGKPVISDLAKMPHLLIAGATGTGKSVFVNSLITALLFYFAPRNLRLVLIDPKILEFTCYEDIPHLLVPVITDAKKAALSLRWLVKEMERRYALMSQSGARNIETYGAVSEKGKLEKLPYIVTVIDELADLMMLAPKDTETSITRLAQMARAAGIHIILATQRPSVDVITGLIKANFPARISFRVPSKVDSRTILDTIGAESLLGFGDMLFLRPGTSKAQRIHGAYVSDEEIKAVVGHLVKQETPGYVNLDLEEKELKEKALADSGDQEIYQEAVSIVRRSRYASISMLQRRLRIGYNRAALLIEQMEQEGIVGAADGSKPRSVL